MNQPPSIKRDKNGVFYWSKRIDGKQVRRSNKKWKSKREAREHYVDFINKVEAEEVTLSRIRYDALVDEYLEFISLSLKKSTVSGHGYRLRSMRRRYFKNVYVDTIDVKFIQQLQNNIFKKQPDGTIFSNNYLDVLQGSFESLLNYAVNFDYINKNPFNILPKVKRHDYEVKEEMTLLTLEQFSTFLSIVDDPIYYAAFSILYWCGLRIGELLALNINDYNSSNKILSIYKNYDTKNNELTTTKTSQNREITVPDACSNDIDALIALYKNSEGKEYNSNMPLFAYNGRIPYTSFNTQKNKYIDILKDNKEVKIEVPYFTPHDLRHTHVSTLIDLGMRDIDIAKRLGHSTDMVNNTYGHLFPERKDLLLDELNNLSNKFVTNS